MNSKADSYRSIKQEHHTSSCKTLALFLDAAVPCVRIQFYWILTLSRCSPHSHTLCVNVAHYSRKFVLHSVGLAKHRRLRRFADWMYMLPVDVCVRSG